MKSHSKILFWLLLAATVALDAVAFTWLLQEGPESLMAYPYDALVSGQLAVVALWAVFGARRTWAAWCGAIVAVCIAATFFAWLEPFSFLESCGIYGSLMALSTATLWTLKRTSVWQRLIGAADPAAWQYSMGHLLAAMTCIAILIAALRGSMLLLQTGELWKFFVMLTLGDIVLTTSIAFIWLWTSQLTSWWPRLAAVLVPGLAIGALESGLSLSGLLGDEVARIQGVTPIALVANTVMVSIVVFAYLELAPIIRRDQRANLSPPAGAADE